jgi:hypothetical protein
MMQSEVLLIEPSGRSIELISGAPAAVVPAGEVTLVIDAGDIGIDLDGRARPGVRISQKTLLSVDLGRSTGYHCLTTDGLRHYRFATEDAKAKLNGVRDMLNLLDREGLSWGGQLFFTDGSGLPDNRVFVRWLQTEGVIAAQALEAILERPRMRSTRVTGASASARPPFDVARSLALYRRDLTVLEERLCGIVHFGDRRFTPRVVVSARRAEEIDSPPNRRAGDLAHIGVRLCATVLEIVPEDMTLPLQNLATRFARALHSPLFRSLSARRRAFSGTPCPEELFDARYASVFRLHNRLSGPLGWTPSLAGYAESFVKHSDEIYQAFVARLLADALDMEPVFDELRPFRSEPSFESARFAMWYDAAPTTLRSWRRDTPLPDRPRPDLCIVEKGTGRAALVDAKYRVRGSLPTNESLAEVQYYLNAFGMATAAVAYPGEDGPPVLAAAEGHKLLALPIGPRLGVRDAVRDLHVPALLMLLDRPTWH